MKLRWKFFLSYLVVIGLVLVAISAALTVVAPEEFSGRLQIMRMPEGLGRGGWHAVVTPQAGAQETPRMLLRQNEELVTRFLEEVQDELQANFRASLQRALVIAGGVAVVASALVSLWISQRIVKPIHALGAASQRIAAGHYEERLLAAGEDELADLTRSFNQMAGALAETETLRQQLIADISHELKTPLTTIKGYMEGLQDGVIQPTPEAFQLVHREADRLQRLVHDLQELSRAEADQLQLHPELHDANELATSAAEWLRPQFMDHNIQLMVVPLAAPARVRADFDRARQVLLNLLGNALQYTPEGGTVTLAVTADREQGAPLIHYAVTDSGLGLAQPDLERIFQRFYRVDPSRTRSSGGSGIGLTIARHIAEAHGGQLRAASPGPGQGSTFTFSLPQAG